MNKDPDIVINSVLDSNGTKTETNKINVYPVSIFRYAWLERLNSPFLNPEIQFGIDSVIPTAYVFCSTPDVLRKYNSNEVEKLKNDAFAWADENITLDDTHELMKNITGQMLKLNKAAPNGQVDSQVVDDGTKKNL